MLNCARCLVVIAILACGAITAPIHAQKCDVAPVFDMNGLDCSASRQTLPCACSECLKWDAAAGATWYEIRRCDAGGKCEIVGDTRWRNHPASTDAGGVVHPGVRSTLWCFAWDNPFPATGATYSYSVRSSADGPTGPVRSAQFSAPVRYAAAPYMCIDNGLEVPCVATTPPPGGSPTDLDGDGITDALDPDDDGDGIRDAIDNCPRTFNLGQRDADHDGVGDACDPEPRIPGTRSLDTDGDGIGDRHDDCPAVYDPRQTDSDGDRTGDACDNCPDAFNELQTDTNHDGVGDACDLDDGVIYLTWGTSSKLSWAPEAAFTRWCVYRGDLAELRRSRTYTQAPGSNDVAARTCDLAVAAYSDADVLAKGAAAFYLVAGRPGPQAIELGADSAGVMRPNANPCP